MPIVLDHRFLDNLYVEILAALSMGGGRPLTAAELARVCPSARETHDPRTARLRDEIYAALMTAGCTMSHKEIAQACPSARSNHEISQQINVLVREGCVKGLTGAGRHRHVYYAIRNPQGNLPLRPQKTTPPAPLVVRKDDGWSIVFKRGGKARKAEQVGPGLQATLDASGAVSELHIRDSVLATLNP